jgi:hypothetical protein
MQLGQHRSVVFIQFVGFSCLLLTPVWVYELLYGDPDYSPTNEYATIPILILATATLLLHLTRNDNFLRQAAFAGLLCKMVATAAFFYIAFWVYGGAADMFGYERYGRHVAEQFAATGRLEFIRPYWSTAAPANTAGLLFIVFGASRALACVFFALLSFWGEFYLYKAFCVAYPEGDRRTAAILLFMLPSIVFWTATIGKDAMVLLFIGISVYGFAKLDRNTNARSLLITLFGLGGVLFVRPHVAGILAMAFVMPYAFATAGRRRRDVAFRLVAIPMLLGTTFFLARGAQQFVGMADLSQAGMVLNRVQSSSNTGTSAFGASASATSRVLAAPVLFFRPFPWEVHNFQAALASLEGMLLLFLTWRYYRQIWAALRFQRRSSFTVFAIVFLAEFSVIFSAAISNFGLLARERTMAVPLFAMLLCIVPARRILNLHETVHAGLTAESWEAAPAPVAGVRADS